MKHFFIVVLFSIISIHIFAYDYNRTRALDTNMINTNTKNGPTVSAFTFETSYVGDFAGNISGGIKTGVAYLGLANISVGIGTEKIGLWKGGEFFINGAATHGTSPSQKLIGDFQVASNIDAGGNYIYIHQFWYKQRFQNIEFTIGIQDLNAEFATSQNSSQFINSSFGIAPVIADNVPCSIFPITGLGISGKLKLTNNITIQMAVFDGFPTGLNNSEYNSGLSINNNDGLLYFSELHFKQEIYNLTGTYKIGYYLHSGLVELDQETNETSSIFNSNMGYYFIADQSVWQKGNRSIGFFTQLAFSPSEINLHNKYMGAGFKFSGWFKKLHDDEIGIAVAYAGFNKELNHKHETVIELYYNLPINKNIYIKPDLQYVINPRGTNDKLGNAFVSFLRIGIQF